MSNRVLHIVPAKTPAWLDFPAIVKAPSPQDRQIMVDFALAKGDATKMAMIGRRELTLEMWSIILGIEPPVPGAARRNRDIAGTLSNLTQAHALFQGIERPLAEDDEGADVLAYVLKPQYMYESNPDMVSVALKVAVPQDVVFVVYARLNKDAQGQVVPKGTITHWHFVEADPADPMLPIDFSSRYRTRMW